MDKTIGASSLNKTIIGTDSVKLGNNNENVNNSNNEQKIKSITIDTLTGIMNELYMKEEGMVTRDKWKDWGKDIWRLIRFLNEKGFTLILILGQPGTGKSTAMRNLKPNTNVWFNADNKNITYSHGIKEYGFKSNPRIPYHIVTTKYDTIYDTINRMLSKNKAEENRYAFLTGHIETFKLNSVDNERLKVIGSMATKMQLEGQLEYVFYARSKKSDSDGNTEYYFETENNGVNTARGPMGVFDVEIPNDYQYIIDKIDKSWIK